MSSKTIKWVIIIAIIIGIILAIRHPREKNQDINQSETITAIDTSDAGSIEGIDMGVFSSQANESADINKRESVQDQTILYSGAEINAEFEAVVDISGDITN